jgi:hypothetical protein
MTSLDLHNDPMESAVADFGEAVLEALDQWYGPDYRYIKVRGYDDGSLYILRFDEPHAEWELTMFVSARARLRMA